MTFALVGQEAPPSKEERARRKKTGTAFTPRMVARQCLGFAVAHIDPAYPAESKDLVPRSPIGNRWGHVSVFDPACGSGVWSSEAKRLLPFAEVVGVELRESDEEWTRRNTDRHVMGDFFDPSVVGQIFRDQIPGEVRIAVTNPDFKRFIEYADILLRYCEHVWLYAPVDSMLRNNSQSEWLLNNAKYVDIVYTTHGSVSFRETGDTDFRQYGLWMLQSTPVGETSSWRMRPMPVLPGHHRKWVTRPGTEPEYWIR